MPPSLATAVDILVSPGEAFRRLHERPSFAFPLLALIVLTVGTVYWYYGTVDLRWLIETQMQQAQGGLPEQQRAALGSDRARSIVGTIAAVSSGVGLVLIAVLWAAYLSFISMLSNDGGRFRLWFSLVCWCSLPTAFSSLATVVNLLVNDLSRAPPERLNPLSFASLLGLEGELSRSERMLGNLDPFVLWTLVLLVLGYHSWSKRSILVSAMILLAPLAVIVAAVVLLS